MLEPALDLPMAATDDDGPRATLTDILTCSLSMHALVAIPLGWVAATRADVLLGGDADSSRSSHEAQMWLRVVGSMSLAQVRRWVPHSHRGAERVRSPAP